MKNSQLKWQNDYHYHHVRNFCFDFFENYRVLHKVVQVLRKAHISRNRKSASLSDTKLKNFFEQKRERTLAYRSSSTLHSISKSPKMSHSKCLNENISTTCLTQNVLIQNVSHKKSHLKCLIQNASLKMSHSKRIFFSQFGWISKENLLQAHLIR